MSSKTLCSSPWRTSVWLVSRRSQADVCVGALWTMAACSHDTVFAGLLPLVVEHLPRLLMRNPKGEEWGVAGHGTATDLHGGESDQERHYYFERAYHLENELEGSREEIEALRKVIGERDESIRGLQAHIEKLEKKIIEQHENLLLTRARAKADACAAAAKQARRTARLPQMQVRLGLPAFDGIMDVYPAFMEAFQCSSRAICYSYHHCPRVHSLSNTSTPWRSRSPRWRCVVRQILKAYNT